MATNHTENYQLNLWEPGDSFLRTEFNENTQKLDAALKAEAQARAALAQQVAARNCRVVTGTYTGTGGHGAPVINSLTFPGNPFFLAVVGDACFWALSPEERAGVMASNGAFFDISLKWSNNAVQWTGISQDFLQLNTKGRVYHYIALIKV